MSTSGDPAHYEIRVEGILDNRWAAWFGGLHIERDDTQTVISGSLADQPALHGLLTKIRDLGLCLISVRRGDSGETGKRGIVMRPTTRAVSQNSRSDQDGVEAVAVDLRGLIVLLLGVGVVRVLVWFGVVQVIGLGMPAGREIGGQRTVSGRNRATAVVCARLGFHCRVNGTSWRGATGRMTVWVWAAARDGISRIQSMSGWSAQRMAARSVGELDGRRCDACDVECLALGQGPGGEQGLRGGA